MTNLCDVHNFYINSYHSNIHWNVHIYSELSITEWNKILLKNYKDVSHTSHEPYPDNSPPGIICWSQLYKLWLPDELLLFRSSGPSGELSLWGILLVIMLPVGNGSAISFIWWGYCQWCRYCPSIVIEKIPSEAHLGDISFFDLNLETFWSDLMWKCYIRVSNPKLFNIKYLMQETHILRVFHKTWYSIPSQNTVGNC